MFSNNKICQLFGIDYPIIQGGMIWCAGWELVAAVSNSGGLGLLGSGSMYPDILREQILKVQAATSRPFGVNIPLIYPDIEKHVQTIIELEVPIVFSSAGNPKTWTKKLQDHGIKVVHVVSSLKFALKAQAAGVDAVVGEGFEAGGHNGREETTTFCLTPLIADHIDIPLIAAGGISSGKSMLAALVLGAQGVQMGSRFVMSKESSAHQNFKEYIAQADEGKTELMLKKLTPVRLLKNDFYQKIKKAESEGKSVEELAKILGRGRAKKGMFEGDLVEGELEIGQVSAQLNNILSVSEIIKSTIDEFRKAKDAITLI